MNAPYDNNNDYYNNHIIINNQELNLSHIYAIDEINFYDSHSDYEFYIWDIKYYTFYLIDGRVHIYLDEDAPIDDMEAPDMTHTSWNNSEYDLYYSGGGLYAVRKINDDELSDADTDINDD